MKEFLPALRFLLAMTILVGVVYPLLVWGAGQALFRDAASGSLVRQDGKVVGSRLIGQAWTPGEYFVGRRPANDEKPYNVALSGGANLGPTNPALAEKFAAVNQLWQTTGERHAPLDLLTSSGSGLDPHISPEAARFQVPLVARTRNIAERDLLRLIDEHTEPRTFGFLGEPVVNLLELNLALERLSGKE